MKRGFVTAAAFLMALSCRAEDWTIDNKTYHNIHVDKVNVDSVTITYDGGIGRIKLTDLSPELQQKYSDDVKKAQVYDDYEKRAATDPIARLVVRLTTPSGMWVNGVWLEVALPKTAKMELVAANALHVVHCQVVKTENIEINDAPYTAILVHSGKDDKIVLLQNIAKSDHWGGARVYDAL